MSSSRTPIVVGCLVGTLLLGGAIVLGVAIGVGLQRKPPAAPVEVGVASTTPEPKPGILGGLLPAAGPVGPEPAITSTQCDEITSGGPVRDGCITDEIRCDQTIVGHTRGGTKHFDTRWYEKSHCTPATTNHDGGDERIYRLELPDGEWHADVWLDTPCGDLDMAAFLWNDRTRCPTGTVDRCDMWPKPGTEREYIQIVTQRKSTWLIVVEGKNSEEGPFALHVKCSPGLH